MAHPGFGAQIKKSLIVAHCSMPLKKRGKEPYLCQKKMPRLCGGLNQKNLCTNAMEDPEFERFFDVYGEDQIETRYILSTSLMERITRLKQKLKEQGAGSIRLSFVDSQLFIAIELGRSFLNIPIFRRFSYVHLLDYYEDLKTLYDVVEELNLNTRIWSKS